MNCRRYSVLLPEHRAGALPPALEAEVAVHLGLCPRCQGEWQRLERLEQELATGLQAWAAAGAPRLDLATVVRAAPDPGAAPAAPDPGATHAAPDPGATPTAGSPGDAPPRPRFRPMGVGPARAARGAGAAVAVAAILAMALWVSFPRWAVAAADWPVVGPWARSIILKDTGLSWALENGLLDTPLVQVETSGFTVKIMAVLADPAQTTVIYEARRRGSGAGPVPAREGTPGPVPAREGRSVGGADPTAGLWTPPPPSPWPELSIAKVDGRGTASWSSAPEETPLGYVGVVSSPPLPAERATLTLIIHDGAEVQQVELPVTRGPISRLAEVTPIDREFRFAGMRWQVHRLIRLPYQTILEYTEYTPPDEGSLVAGPREVYLETPDGRQLVTAAGGQAGLGQPDGGYRHYDIFPPVAEPVAVVLPRVVTVRPVDLAWDLPPDPAARTQVLAETGTPVTLARWEQRGEEIYFELEFPAAGALDGLGHYGVVGADGTVHRPEMQAETLHRGGRSGLAFRGFYGRLPAGVEPVRLLVREAAVLVEGPWRFELDQAGP